MDKIKLNEKRRIYTFADNDATVVIVKPRWLIIHSTGTHQLITEDGRTHYVMKRFIHIEIVPNE